MANVILQDINKVYDNNVQAVFDFNLTIGDGEFIVLVGPSGCGKSITLRMIAGLEEITEGKLFIDDVFSNYILPKNRDTAMVFQNYALYPHMTVYQNMAFGLKNRHVPKEEIAKRVEEAANILGISEYLKRKPKALSGGQCQRVALGRAIVRNAKVFLMDEPLSNLDAKLRVQMRSEIIKLHKRIGGITIYVTHDQTEAMTMADRIVVMNKGYIQQIGTPREIYNHPANLFVAGFIGSPSMNFIPAKLDNGKVYVGDTVFSLTDAQKDALEGFFGRALERMDVKLANYDKNFFDRSEALEKIEYLKKLPDQNQDVLDKIKSYEGYVQYLEQNAAERVKIVEKIDYLKSANTETNEKFIFGIRPEDIEVYLDDNHPDVVACEVAVTELLGHNQIAHLNYNGHEILAELSAKKEIKIGQIVYVHIAIENIHLFDEVSEDCVF